MFEVFHRGELDVQRKAGVRERMAQMGPRLIRDQMPQQHQEFFAKLPFVLIGAVDSLGQPWASILTNPPGFLVPLNSFTLSVQASFIVGDPLEGALVTGNKIGLLGIEPHTQRRNRVNGSLGKVSDDSFFLNVEQSFGNCPKYIHRRHATFRPTNAALPKNVASYDQLDSEAEKLIGNTDTFFIATAHSAVVDARTQGVDVSHRGGAPGFVQITSKKRLRVADYAGNSFFNTFGNLTLNPRTGLLFIDYSSGDLLYLATVATIEWMPASDHVVVEPVERFLQFDIERVVRIRGAVPLNWEEVES
jgi:uncharacterized protein